MNNFTHTTTTKTTENKLPDYMSLRDYFAGKALTGLVQYNDYGNASDADVAKGAYEYADAMLEARTLNQKP